MAKVARALVVAIFGGLALSLSISSRAGSARVSWVGSALADQGTPDASNIEPASGGAPASGDLPKGEGDDDKSAPKVDAQPKRTGSSGARGKDVEAELKKPIYKKTSLSIGAPHFGRQVRAKRLKSEPTLHILKKGSDRVFGHPSLVLMLHRSAKTVAKAFPGSKLLVGDLSSEDGGSLSGHHSHQSGRDADVIFYARDENGKMTVPKKFVTYGADGKAVDGSGLVFDDERNWLLVESWAKDKRAGLHYVFVARWLKTRLLAFALKHPKYKNQVPDVAPLFVQPEGAEPHDDHFHVRIKCPAGQEKLCIE